MRFSWRRTRAIERRWTVDRSLGSIRGAVYYDVLTAVLQAKRSRGESVDLPTPWLPDHPQKDGCSMTHHYLDLTHNELVLLWALLKETPETLQQAVDHAIMMRELRRDLTPAGLKALQAKLVAVHEQMHLAGECSDDENPLIGGLG